MQLQKRDKEGLSMNTMFVLLQIGGYVKEVRLFANLADAQDKMIEKACEDYGIVPATFEALEYACDGGSLDAMFVDQGTQGCDVFQIFEVPVE